MTSPAAKGERFIAVAGETLCGTQCVAAARVPRFEAPNWVVRLVALGIPLLRDALAQLGKVRRASGAKARNTLGWTPRGNEEIIVASADSLIRLGLVKS